MGKCRYACSETPLQMGRLLERRVGSDHLGTRHILGG